MAEIVEPFEFRQCLSILKPTGKKARNLRELRDIIEIISDDCIFHHAYQYFIKGHVLEYTNDFAHWAGESLEERTLSEYLSNVDPYDFPDIQNLRQEIIRVLDDYLATFPAPREAMPGDEFYFNETVTLIFPVGVRARNLAEFCTAMKFVDAGSIYYHFYEARIRLGKGVDDFSRWIEYSFGKAGLAGQIREIDPFMHTIEEIRRHIVSTTEEEVRRDMEGVDRCLTSM